MNFTQTIFYPISAVYSSIMRVRNLLFNKGILKSEKVSAKVISIGNLTVGGSGKTPTVIYVLELLKKNGYKPAVLSRGYRRKTTVRRSCAFLL